MSKAKSMTLSIDEQDAVNLDLDTICSLADLINLAGSSQSEPRMETLERVGELLDEAAKRIYERLNRQDPRNLVRLPRPRGRAA